MIQVLDGVAAADWADAVFETYDAVFGDWPDPESWRRDLFDRHRGRDGYRLAIAPEGGRVLGFAWAYVGQPGQFWSDLVSSRLPTVAPDWIGGHLELVELAVLASARGQGLGGRLLESALAGWDGCVMLSTDAAESPAVRLYHRHGFASLGMLEPGVQVMGRRG